VGHPVDANKASQRTRLRFPTSRHLGFRASQRLDVRAAAAEGESGGLFNFEDVAKPFISAKETLNEGIATFYDESSVERCRFQG
jgi:hypothetical protein